MLRRCCLSGVVVLACALDTVGALQTTMKPIRYCSDKRWWGCKARGYPYGTFWDQADMSEDNQDKAFFAIVGQPPSRGSVEYIAIFSSGQQGSSGGSSGDAENVVSGAHDDWKWNTNENGEEPRTVNDNSVAGKFYDEQILPSEKTLYLSIWDAQFNHMASSGEKTDTLDGYANFLNSKVFWSNIKGIVLVGTSRGGCLAMRLSQHLRTKFSLDAGSAPVQFAVGSVDGVCKKSQSELGTTGNTLYNPMASAPQSYRAYKTDMEAQFPAEHRDNYCIFHLAGGDEVTGIALGVRTFTHQSCSSETCSLIHNGKTWYTQHWMDLCHKCAGRDFSEAAITIDPMMQHLRGCKAQFGWEQTVPPIGVDKPLKPVPVPRGL